MRPQSLRTLQTVRELAGRAEFQLTMSTEEQPAGRLDYRVWLCSNHDKVEESIKAASSQVKDSASGIQKSLKGLCTS